MPSTFYLFEIDVSPVRKYKSCSYSANSAQQSCEISDMTTTSSKPFYRIIQVVRNKTQSKINQDEDDIPKKNKLPVKDFKRQTTGLRDISLKFLRTTSLHALKFIGDNEVTNSEKYFFAIAFLLAVIISSYYITAIYLKWMDSPIITTTSSISTSIASIPFPAITICNLNQATRSIVRAFKSDSLNYWRLQSICKPNVNIDPEILVQSGRWTEYREFILNVSQPCEEMILSCKFGAEPVNCGALFQPILTDEGLCCTFNNVDTKFIFLNDSYGIMPSKLNDWAQPVNWSPENGYEENLPEHFYPATAIGTGAHMGLSLILNASLKEYYCSSSNSVGFKMFMHSPIEMPKIANYGYLLSPGMESRIVIQPEFYTAASTVRSIALKYRNCLFLDESNLTFYRTYSKLNCELECESQRVEEMCGCVLYYLPRRTKHTIICGLKDLNCTRRVQVDSDSLRNNNVTCSLCLPGCFSLSYLPLITTNALAYDNFQYHELELQNDTEIESLAVVHFFYEHNSFRGKTKEELLNFTGFLANSGGILGLFMGFSILAVIEFFYFVFLATYCAIKKFMNNEKKIKEETKIEQAQDSRINIQPNYYTYSQNYVNYSNARASFRLKSLHPYCE